jgi:hypothetical protein
VGRWVWSRNTGSCDGTAPPTLDQRADAPLHFANGGIWLRISAYAYNEIDDQRR